MTRIHGNASEVYYKIYKSTRNGLMTVVCMQWFDEMDYHKENFVVDSSGDIHQFENEDDAIAKLNIWFEQDQIDPEYRQANRQDVSLVRD